MTSDVELDAPAGVWQPMAGSTITPAAGGRFRLVAGRTYRPHYWTRDGLLRRATARPAGASIVLPFVAPMVPVPLKLAVDVEAMSWASPVSVAWRWLDDDGDPHGGLRQLGSDSSSVAGLVRVPLGYAPLNVRRLHLVLRLHAPAAGAAFLLSAPSLEEQEQAR